MPNRIVREGILTSERVNLLDWEEEVFYRRLLSVVDDYGRFVAHPQLLLASLFPLKLETVRKANLERHLTACERARLVRLYEVDGKRYLQVLDFNQQIRAKNGSKYPDPPPEPPEEGEPGKPKTPPPAPKPLNGCAPSAAHVRTKAEAEAHSESKTEAEAPPGADTSPSFSEKALALANELGITAQTPARDKPRFSKLVDTYGVEAVRESVRAAFTRKEAPIGPGVGLVGWVASRLGGRAADEAAAKARSTAPAKRVTPGRNFN